jgi:CRISPR system Cascade subunit CasE
VANVRAVPARVTGGQRTARSRPRLVFGSALFEGLIEVTDVDLFRQALVQGIGSGKAYGFGLLSIAPA